MLPQNYGFDQRTEVHFETPYITFFFQFIPTALNDLANNKEMPATVKRAAKGALWVLQGNDDRQKTTGISNMASVTRKGPPWPKRIILLVWHRLEKKSEKSVSYQKKDGRVTPMGHFLYDNDSDH